jgi:hypothetical protein
MEEKSPKTLILVCRRNFCRILDRVLRSEGLSDFRHGDLSLVGGLEEAAQVGGATEVFVVSADAGRVERLIKLLRACPIRGGAEKNFELYTVS